MVTSLQLEFERPFVGQRVLVTGATGFKGSWLSIWLASLGAKVYGISLEPDCTPSLYKAAKVDQYISHTILDICQKDQVIDCILSIDPVVVFHLAAQPLVRRSYREPLRTFETNVLGTAHVLEACRRTTSTRSVVCVTTDKVYANDSRFSPYNESDRLGGVDPYSASKACAELIAECYRASLNKQGNAVFVATARGGNIIGGGDWSEDRLIPDLVRAVVSSNPLAVRNPKSTRPWQHVLSLCHAYLLLAYRLAERDDGALGPWNFGPPIEDCVPVQQLLDMFGEFWQRPQISYEPDSRWHEADILAVDSTRARTLLKWNPPWTLKTVVQQTALWYRGYYSAPQQALQLTQAQIEQYRRDLANSSIR